jgi:Mn-dependent DtxR family transcriptional regulator
VLYGVLTCVSQPTQCAEDYLERIHELIEAKGYARVVDIASSLEVKQASVTSMVQKLDELGYLDYKKYRRLILTDKGLAVAHKIKRRHETLSRFFSLLGLDAKTQHRDIEGIEHHLSSSTMEMIADIATFFEKNPDTLQSVLKFRSRRHQ